MSDPIFLDMTVMQSCIDVRPRLSLTSNMVARPKVLGSVNPYQTQANNKQTKNNCIFLLSREKIKKKHKQSINNSNMSTCTALYKKEHICTSNYIINNQICPLKSVSHASLMAQTPLTAYSLVGVEDISIAF